jgi:hypothetical protein
MSRILLRASAFAACLAFVPFVSGVVFADDPPAAKPDENQPTAKPASTTTVTFGDGVAKFEVSRDPSGRAILFRQTDPAVRITTAPVMLVRTDRGEEQVPLVAVDGSPNVWRFANPRIATGRFTGTMRLVVADRPYTAQVVVDAPVRIAPRFGGYIVPLEACHGHVEIVHDAAGGALLIHASPELRVEGQPTVVLTGAPGAPGEVVVAPVEGKPGVWRVSHASFRTTGYVGTLRLMVAGTACEAPLAFAAPRGGRLVTIEGGPRFEVVSAPEGGGYVVYALDETIDGRPVVIERPEVVWTTPEGPRTVRMVPIEGEPRAWRLVGLDAGTTPPGDARLRFTLFGRSLEGRIGPSGLGLEAR